MREELRDKLVADAVELMTEAQGELDELSTQIADARKNVTQARNVLKAVDPHHPLLAETKKERPAASSNGDRRRHYPKSMRPETLASLIDLVKKLDAKGEPFTRNELVKAASGTLSESAARAGLNFLREHEVIRVAGARGVAGGKHGAIIHNVDVFRLMDEDAIERVIADNEASHAESAKRGGHASRRS